GKEVFVAKQDENVVEKEVDATQVQVSTPATTPTISIDEVTLAQALAELKQTKPKAKAKGIIFHEPEQSTTTTTTTTATIPKPKSQDKLQAELQAKFDKEQRLARKKAQKEEEEANITLIETWDDVQAKIYCGSQTMMDSLAFKDLAVSLSSSMFCFLAFSCSSSYPALFKLPSVTSALDFLELSSTNSVM
nr:hypothetical protein [Tanacetum cinerariifolium]